VAIQSSSGVVRFSGNLFAQGFEQILQRRPFPSNEIELAEGAPRILRGAIHRSLPPFYPTTCAVSRREERDDEIEDQLGGFFQLEIGAARRHSVSPDELSLLIKFL
jgi:hypothetical protein